MSDSHLKAGLLTKYEELDAFALLLKEKGYTVIMHCKPATWINFYKDGATGYVQKGHFSGWDFSTSHKPTREIGTGIGTFQNVDLDIDYAEKTLRMQRSGNYPFAVRGKENIQLYASAEEYKAKSYWKDDYVL